MARRSRTTIYVAPCTPAPTETPADVALLHADASSSASVRARVRAAMRRADESGGLVASRFARGDEFFAWLGGGDIVCFGWVTRGPRWIGGVRMALRPDRVFLFNFHTVAAHRGRGLYPALLRAIRGVLASARVAEAIIDVNVRNVASAKGIEKAGFAPIARTEQWSVLERWSVNIAREVLDAACAPVFG